MIQQPGQNPEPGLWTVLGLKTMHTWIEIFSSFLLGLVIIIMYIGVN
jgi:hypothetical protein